MSDKLKLSHSAVALYQSCPTSFYWTYIRKKVIKGCNDKPPFQFGGAIHKALEVYALSLKEHGDRNLAIGHAFTAFKKSFPSDLTDKHTQKSGLLMLRDYFDYYEVDNVEILDTEKKYSVELDNCIYRAVLDNTIQQDGRIMIRDYKTASDLGLRFIRSAKPNGQFTSYIYVAQKTIDPAIDSLLVDGLLVPKPLKTKPMTTAFERIITHRTPMELQRWEDNLKWTADEILESMRTGRWLRYDDRYQACSNYFGECDYFDACIDPRNACDVTLPDDLYEDYIRRG